MERKYFDSSYGKVSYIEREGTNPIVFLHGLGGTGNSWTKLTPYIDEKRGCILIDMVGHGHSDKPMTDYTIRLQENIIKEFINSKGVENYILMGNSYGGWVSLRYTIDVEKPSMLILEDSAGINVTYGEVSEEVRNRFIDSIVSSNSYNKRFVIESIIKNNIDPKWKIKDEDFRNIDVKTLIIWGSDDHIIDINYGKKMNELIPKSKFVEIENGGHTPHIRKPKETADAIDSFITI